MTDPDPIMRGPAAAPSGARTTTASPAPVKVTFARRELDPILSLYGRMVAAGEWRDYAMDFARDTATFSIFRRSSEMPLYRIVKDPRLRNRQGQYAVIAATGLILKRGHDLVQVLRVFDKKSPSLVE